MADQPTPDERRFRALASSSVEHVAEIDETGRIVYVSPDARPGRDVTSLGFDRIHPDDQRAVAESLGEAMRTGESRRAAFRVVDPEARAGWLWLEVTITPFEAENDERHALIVSRDVSDARLLESSLRETRERFRRVAENAYDMISEHDASGRMLY
jgi:two-component system sporulation sensor kinase A